LESFIEKFFLHLHRGLFGGNPPGCAKIIPVETRKKRGETPPVLWVRGLGPPPLGVFKGGFPNSLFILWPRNKRLWGLKHTNKYEPPSPKVSKTLRVKELPNKHTAYPNEKGKMGPFFKEDGVFKGDEKAIQLQQPFGI